MPRGSGVDSARGRRALNMRSLRPEAFAFTVAFYILTLLNWPFWSRLHHAVEPGNAFEWLFLGSVFLVALAGYFLVLCLVSFRGILRPVAIVLLLVSAVASHFMSEYGLLIDPVMIKNVIETDPAEAGDLITMKLVLFVGLLGVLPGIALGLVPIAYRPLAQSLKTKLLAAAVAVTASLVVAAPFVMNYASVFREHREMRFALAPYNVFSAGERLLQGKFRTTGTRVAQFGTDARLLSSSPRRKVTVLVIGETARAANFSLNGYGRETNPKLNTVPDLVSLGNVRSCGTSTAESVPCMFSGLGRQGYGAADGRPQENLLDIVQRAGVSVLWRDNQAGCKGVCARVPSESLTRKGSAAGSDGESHDDVLLDGLQDRIAAATGDGLIVLHMMGSHGPAYYKRYPAGFAAFLPACMESQFGRCSGEEITNAYDNTIRYTDEVLFRLIEILRQADKGGVATAMIYVSDHGESLGENGIYLHGLPYALAPDVQKHVPFLLWLSETFRTSTGVQPACLSADRDRMLSHDNLFHSVLGLLGISTKVYRSDLDIFATCRSDRLQTSSAVRLNP